MVVPGLHFRAPDNTRSVVKLLDAAHGELLARVDTKAGLGSTVSYSNFRTQSVFSKAQGNIDRIQICHWVFFVNIGKALVPLGSEFLVGQKLRKDMW